jgi:hypothetical protein
VSARWRRYVVRRDRQWWDVWDRDERRVVVACDTRADARAEAHSLESEAFLRRMGWNRV